MMFYVPKRAGWIHIQAFVLVACVFFSTAILATFFFFHNQVITEQQLKNTLQTYAALGALQISADDLTEIDNRTDMKSPTFLRVTEQLYTIRERIANVSYVYIMRRTEDPVRLAFVSDAELYFHPKGNDRDANGQIDLDEAPSYPGLLYDISEVPALQGPAFEGSTSDEEVTVDQWGSFLSSYAPIKNEEGKTVAILGIDMDAEEFLAASQSLFRPTVFILVILLGLFVATYTSVLIWRRRIEYLRELEEERSALINLALHQLGGPVAIFRWWLEILKDREDMNHDEKSREICEEMSEGVNRMSSIMAALREISAFEHAAYKRSKEPTSVSDLAKEIEPEFAARLKMQHKRLRLDIADDTKPVFMDKKLLSAILREFISNAIDYSPQDTEIVIRAYNQAGRNVRIQVEDHGYGIPPADLPRIFQKFARGSNAPKYKPAGNGIGLFFAKKAVDRAGGRLWVKSELGKGTTFFFTLPTK